jgi:hypothetical protein
MIQEFEKIDRDAHSRCIAPWTEPTEKIPMHPDDFNALLAWITAKRYHEKDLEKSFVERPVYSMIIG